MLHLNVLITSLLLWLLFIRKLQPKTYAEKDITNIVSFAQMYEGIKDVLQSNIQSDILQTKRSIDSDLAKEVLKAL